MKRLVILLGLVLTLPWMIPGVLLAQEEPPAPECKNYKCECRSPYPGSIIGQYSKDFYSSENSSLTNDEACRGLCEGYFQGYANVTFNMVCLDETLPFVPLVDPEKKAAAFPELIVDLDGFGKNEHSFIYNKDGTLQANILGDYVNTVYILALTAVSLFTVVQLMIGGLQYATARGDAGQVSKAKDRIKNSIFGLVLLLLAYNIAYIINPATTNLQPLSLSVIPRVEQISTEGEEVDINTWRTLSTSFVPIEGTHLIAYSDTVINPDILPYLNEAADAYYDLSNGKNIIVADAVRTVRDQATKFYNNCIRNGGICSPPTCNPTVPSDGLVKKVDDKYTLTGELANVPVTDAATIINALTTHGNVGNCNHTSGYALDLWPEGHLPNFINNVDDMELLVQVMTDHGFCRLKSEVWHFEFINTGVTLSKNCDTDYSDLTYYRDGKPITPDPECTYWDFNNNHECVDGKLR